MPKEKAKAAEPNKPDPPFVNELYIDQQFWPAKRGTKKTTLTISLDALVEILYRENAVIAEEDVPGLLGAIHAYAVKADKGSEDAALAEWEEHVTALEDDDEEEEGGGDEDD